jgi:hypothetical protein
MICNSAFSTDQSGKAAKADRECVLSRYGKPSYAFTYDHIIPLELDGADTCDNLWPKNGPRRRSKTRSRTRYIIESAFVTT